MKKSLLIAGIVILILGINYIWIDLKIQGFLIQKDYEFAKVERVIDGDTIIADGDSVRLLGVNSPERGEVYYTEAKEFLENQIINRTIMLEYGSEKEDRYGRKLAYVFLNDVNLNLKIVEEGLGNYYFPSEKDIYYNQFVSSWKTCIENEKNLCEKSENRCIDCIELKKFDYYSQEAVIYNQCNYECSLNNWTIKDEGRKKFIFEDFKLGPKKEIGITAEDFGEKYVWTKTGDTLFLRDDEGKLVLYESY